MSRMNKTAYTKLLSALAALVVFYLNAGPVTAQEEGPILHISWPNEGETLYSAPTSLLYSIPVRGFVENYDLAPYFSTVQLMVVRDGEEIGSLTQQLTSRNFEFLVTVNPHHSIGVFPAEHEGCGTDCHQPGHLELVPGALALVMKLASPEGMVLATTERNVIVDHSASSAIPVALIMEDPAAPAPPGVTVRGSAWLYLWRARYALAHSDSTGQASLTVEALSQAPTEYLIEVEPTVVDGVLYEGLDSRRVLLEPGASAAEPITLTVKATRGAIEGRISPSEAVSDNVWAICSHNGRSVQAQVGDDGAFAFHDIALDRYELVLDQDALVDAGYIQIARTLPVDLVSQVNQTVTIELATISPHRHTGRIDGQAEGALPFAWMTPLNGARAYTVLPDSGEYAWINAQEGRASVILQAPGYYSRAVFVHPGDAAAVEPVSLTPHPQTRMLAWGDGTLTLPDDSDLEQDGNTIALSQGWLWGNGAAQQPFTITAGPYELQIRSGEFALEFRPSRRGWLYLLAGEAQLRHVYSGASLALQGGQMVNLLNHEGPVAAPYDPVVVAALQERGASPLPQSWEPSLTARLRDGLARTGIGVAQVITFVTYILVCIAIVSAPAYILYLKATRKKRQT